MIITKSTITRLEPPFDTNCRKYTTNEEKVLNIISQKQCIKRCHSLYGEYMTINSIEFKTLNKTSNDVIFKKGFIILHV